MPRSANWAHALRDSAVNESTANYTRATTKHRCSFPLSSFFRHLKDAPSRCAQLAAQQPVPFLRTQ